MRKGIDSVKSEKAHSKFKMIYFSDVNNRKIRFTDERRNHLEQNHPGMVEEERRIKETLESPDKIVLSKTDSEVQLFYKYFENTPVNAKYLCVIVKSTNNDNFIITSYFTDSIKKGKLLWIKK